MGVSVKYQAIPPSSVFFGRLQSDMAFALLTKRVFKCGNSIYSLFDEPERFKTMLMDSQVVEGALLQTPPEFRETARQAFELLRQNRGKLSAVMGLALDEDLQELIDEHPDVFGPEHEARRRVDDFRLALEQIREAHPGIEGRNCLLENAWHSIQEGLVRELVGARGTGTSRYVSSLMFGDERIGRDLALPEGDRMGLVTPALVREGAHLLLGIDAPALFAEDGAGCIENFSGWRQLYQAAAARDEALLVD